MTQLRVLICEDEYLLASDMAAELERCGAAIAGVIGRVADLETMLARDDFAADVAVLDARLLDGMAYPLIPTLLARGMRVVFCTAYASQEMPAEFASIPRIGKPADTDRLWQAVRGEDAVQPA